MGEEDVKEEEPPCIDLTGDSSGEEDVDDDDLHEIVYYDVIQSKTTGNIVDFKFDEETKTVELADPEETELKYGLLRLIINKQSKEIVSIGFVQEEEELVTACKNDIVSIGSVPEQVERVTAGKRKWQPETTPVSPPNSPSPSPPPPDTPPMPTLTPQLSDDWGWINDADLPSDLDNIDLRSSILLQTSDEELMEIIDGLETDTDKEMMEDLERMVDA